SSPSASWFNADTVSPGLGDPESDVPGALFELLDGGKQTANHKTFADLKSAEEAFLAAWVKARKGGWKPVGKADAEEPPPSKSKKAATKPPAKSKKAEPEESPPAESKAKPKKKGK